MAVPNLETVAVRTRGRAAKPITCEYVRDLRPADLALLASERGIQPVPIVKIRDRHHALARCLAQGMRPAEASLVTGYDLSRISILSSDPTFRELITSYKSIEDGLQADFMTRASTLTLSAMNRLQEAFEDDETPVSVPVALEIFKAGADRIGHAPVQRNQNVNVNVELGTRLERARQRLAERSANVIDSTATEIKK